MNEFLQKWNSADQKQAIITELEEEGVIWDALYEEVGKEFGAFDLICHVVFDQPPLTRKERADNVKKRNYFTKYGDKTRNVLEALLEKYDAIKSNLIPDELLPAQINRVYNGRITSSSYSSSVRNSKNSSAIFSVP